MSRFKCQATVDYQTYYPTRDGHAIHADDVWQSFEPTEEASGATHGHATCAKCGATVAVTMANGWEHDSFEPERARMPHNTAHWNSLNRIGAP